MPSHPIYTKRPETRTNRKNDSLQVPFTAKIDDVDISIRGYHRKGGNGRLTYKISGGVSA